MGAWAAGPDRATIAVTGDGGFGQFLAELTTAVKYRMNITHVLLDNTESGKITEDRRAGQRDVWQTARPAPSFADFAGSCGAFGVRVAERGQLEEALQAGPAHDGPALIEVMTHAEPL